MDSLAAIFLMILINGAATFYVSNVLAEERGPFDLFLKVRSHFMWTKEGEPKQDSWITEGIYCPICISFWVSLVLSFPIALIFVHASWISWINIYIVIFLAAAGVSSFLTKLVNGVESD